MNALQKWGKFVPKAMDEGFAEFGRLAFGSIRDGSALTGAPGQPIGRGDLYESWLHFFDSPHSQVVSSDSDHAVPVEEGINRWGQVVFKSGGSHSVALTSANADRLADQAFPRGWADGGR